MNIGLIDYMAINPKTNRPIKKRVTVYTATTEAEAREQHNARIEAGEIEAPARTGGWYVKR
jgi:hypothetical protein